MICVVTAEINRHLEHLDEEAGIEAAIEMVDVSDFDLEIKGGQVVVSFQSVELDLDAWDFLRCDCKDETANFEIDGTGLVAVCTCGQTRGIDVEELIRYQLEKEWK